MFICNVGLGLSVFCYCMVSVVECSPQYPSWYPVNPCHVGCVNCLGCNNVLILNNSSFGGQTSSIAQPGGMTTVTTPPPPTTAPPTTTRPTRKVTVTTTWYIYPQWCPYCQRPYGQLKKCLPLVWLNQ